MNQPSIAPEIPKKPFPWLLIVIIVIIAVGGILAWSYFSNNTTQTASSAATNQSSADKEAAELATADCDKYSNEKYDLTINYPKNYKYAENNSPAKTANGGELLAVVFTNQTLGDNYKVIVAVADLKSSISPDGMSPISTKDVLMAGKIGKNFDDIAYVVDGSQYRYRVTISDQADSTLKIMAKAMAKAIQFTSTTTPAAATTPTTPTE